MNNEHPEKDSSSPGTRRSSLRALIDRLRHAFAVDPPGPAAPSETQRVLIERLSAEVARRRLTGPALLLLEMSRPLNYVSAQLLHFFQPLVAIVTDTGGYQQLTGFLEQRGSIDYLCQRLEAAERELTKRHGQD